jgi:hypothetical protein
LRKYCLDKNILDMELVWTSTKIFVVPIWIIEGRKNGKKFWTTGFCWYATKNWNWTCRTTSPTRGSITSLTNNQHTNNKQWPVRRKEGNRPQKGTGTRTVTVTMIGYPTGGNDGEEEGDKEDKDDDGPKSDCQLWTENELDLMERCI